MGRILFFVLFILGGFVVTIALIQGNAQTQQQSLALAQDSRTKNDIIPPATSGDFSQTGTLVFYPNNVGPVPYLFYPNQKGSTVSEALVFLNSPPYGFSSWSGARISVTGHEDQEHVVVSTIRYISGP